MRKMSFALLLMLTAFCAAASADPIQKMPNPQKSSWFYNRIGGGIDQLNTDLIACNNFAHNMLVGANVTGAGVVGPGIAADILNVLATSSATLIFVDDCMVSLGYRRFVIEGEPLNEFKVRFANMDAALKEAYVGEQSPPEGILTRQWENSVWLGPNAESTIQRPGVLPVATGPLGNRYSRVIRPIRSVPSTLGANDAVIVVSVRRILERGRVGHSDQSGLTELVFGQVDREGGESSAIVVADIRSSRLAGSDEDQILDQQNFIFIVPAGTYYLKSAWAGLPVRAVEFCLGTPAFSIHPGEVLHAGLFSLRPGGERMAPSVTMAALNLKIRLDTPNLEEARPLFLSLDIAARLRKASWQNGFVSGCPRSVGRPIYGFDIPGVRNIHVPAGDY